MSFNCLKDPSQPLPFSIPSKLLILHGEVKSCCFTASCAPEIGSGRVFSGSAWDLTKIGCGNSSGDR